MRNYQAIDNDTARPDAADKDILRTGRVFARADKVAVHGVDPAIRKRRRRPLRLARPDVRASVGVPREAKQGRRIERTLGALPSLSFA